MHVAVTTHYLELLSKEDLRPAKTPRAALELKQVKIPSPEFNRFLYTAVGADWSWVDRLSWPRARWSEYLAKPGVETWVGYVEGTPAGYFELEQQAACNVEIVYFGVLPQFTGKGLGGHLLTLAASRAFELGAQRVWLHTCSLDHPQALANYQSRGFRVFKVETEVRELPGATPEG